MFQPRKEEMLYRLGCVNWRTLSRFMSLSYSQTHDVVAECGYTGPLSVRGSELLTDVRDLRATMQDLERCVG